jgi:hypothetical protein
MRGTECIRWALILVDWKWKCAIPEDRIEVEGETGRYCEWNDHDEGAG